MLGQRWFLPLLISVDLPIDQVQEFVIPIQINKNCYLCQYEANITMTLHAPCHCDLYDDRYTERQPEANKCRDQQYGVMNFSIQAKPFVLDKIYPNKQPNWNRDRERLVVSDTKPLSTKHQKQHQLQEVDTVLFAEQPELRPLGFCFCSGHCIHHTSYSYNSKTTPKES